MVVLLECAASLCPCEYAVSLRNDSGEPTIPDCAAVNTSVGAGEGRWMANQ
ncbi:hypothetical protein PAMC26510_20230 [Caballeronia sordidicola]|uniref:Uncharacterized protein n=1 Tax=Caballeronia sordidicola TaxID=196367 RepID=A0A242MPL6_CABSO|nr:hypothetical protein PAMC26510_20230 [Caballeronia sordidicola]